jgi:ABC-2 type transport system ATP-binding protein
VGLSSSDPVVAVEGLSKRFGEVLAVDAVDFEVAAGETVALLGANGAGKTTTLGMLLGILLPTAGRVSVFGCDMRRHAHLALPWMNFSSPYVGLPKRLTVRENLTVYAHLYGLDRVRGRVEDVARALGLGEVLDRPTGSLSAGQTTRVALAKALVNEPRLLLLDEPTASLDPDTADWVRGLLEDYRRRSGAALVLASHNMAEVERLADRVLIMLAGRIVARGRPKAMLAEAGRATLEELFLDIARGRPGRAPTAAEQRTAAQ